MQSSRHFSSVLTIVYVWGTASNLTFAAASEFKFIKNSQPQYTIHLEKDFTFDCTTNDPEATTSLYFRPNNGRKFQLRPPEPGKVVQRGQTYTIKKFGLNDDGRYQCRAQNKKGESIAWNDSDGETVLVETDPVPNSIRVNPNTIVIPVGRSFNFNCSSNSQAKLEWRKVLNNRSEVPVSSYRNQPGAFHFRLLVTKNAKLTDSGVYRCVLTYRGKTERRDVKLRVYAFTKPIITSFSGEFTDPVMVKSSNKLSIQCTVKGYPRPTVYWYKNGQMITVPNCNDDERNSCQYPAKYSMKSVFFAEPIRVQSNLTILQTSFPDDHGTYTCMANNTQGRANSTTFVSVLAEPRISKEKHREIKVSLGDIINETCSATGNPVPVVVWTRTDDPNKKELSSGKGKALLVVKNVQGKSLGNYTCNATNIIKSVTAIFTIKESKGATFLGRTQEQSGMSSSTLIGLICACVVFTFIVIIISFVLYRRQKRQTNVYKKLYFMKLGNISFVIDPDRSLLEQCNNLPYDLDWEFPEERLILGEPLGSGAFGQVLKAEAIGMPAFKPRDKTSSGRQFRSRLRKSKRRSKEREHISLLTAKQTVAVKTLREEASESDYKDLASELKILIHLGEHKNIVNVLGACTRGHRLMVIIEYAPHGDLLSFLRSKRDIYEPNWVKTSNNPDQEFTLVDLGMTAYQISRGMEFLASKKCVHRDLAARNVLVGHNYVIKISDFGLARDIYQDDLYVKTTSGLLPIKWMALESLFDRVCTEKSDVWSFGILLWEIFTLGGCPYPAVPLENILEYLTAGNRMQQPSHCPSEMYDIMRECWRKDPEQRPTFVKLVTEIKRILEKNVPKGNPHVCLETDEQLKATNYYLTPEDQVSGRGKPESLVNQSAKVPKKCDDCLPKVPSNLDNGMPSTSGRNVGSEDIEENGNIFIKEEKTEGRGEEKPLLFQYSSSTPSTQKYINQHESSV